MPLVPGTHLGTYRILTLLGAGGMGEVYRAHDTRLGRDVALKLLRGPETPEARERVWREARTAAKINHPGVCQIYDVLDAGAEIGIAMELLDGRPLAARIDVGAVPLAEAGDIALAILDALTALHAQRIVHRDLKPSNVFLTAHGVKLVDFGVARSAATDVTGDVPETQAAVISGTPRYMAPEQWATGLPDPRSDLFALGALVYEMLAGRPAFPGSTIFEIHHAVMTMHPAALAGSAAVAAVDGVLHRAMEKRAEDRYASAADMAADLRRALAMTETLSRIPVVRVTTRLVALPFRLLRPDADLDFLGFSLPDAVSASLSGLESLVVRSTMASAKFGDRPDLGKLGQELGVDAALSGTILRVGDQVRLSAQLIEVPAGTVLWTKNVQVALRDLFQVQDDLATAVVEALAVPLSAREERQRRHDVPANARAYESFLRAGQIAYDMSQLDAARELLQAAVDGDPAYAPAWAKLGRVLRLLAKYGDASAQHQYQPAAEAAFRRALEINPDLGLAHNLYTYFEVESLGHAREAMVRLIERAHARVADPDLFAGLVVACRYCGLLAASAAAAREARRLDPAVRTSLTFTLFMQGAWEDAIAADLDDVRFVTAYAGPLVGRSAEAIAKLRELEGRPLLPIARQFARAHRAAVEGDRAELVRLQDALAFFRFDPEGEFFGARAAAHVGEVDRALTMLDHVVGRGFYCPAILRGDPWLAPLRAEARFTEVLARADARSAEAAVAFRQAGGEKLLGPAN
jgi:serine/threonine protein kinase/tetratricopeptide (TPR) repeat protein